MRVSPPPRHSADRGASTSAAKRHLSGRRLLEAERDVLRALFQGTPQGSVLARGIALLANYRFREPAHQVMFEALRNLGRADPARIRELLPARLNNRGFPDLDLGYFFEPHHLTAKQVFSLIRALHNPA